MVTVAAVHIVKMVEVTENVRVVAENGLEIPCNRVEASKQVRKVPLEDAISRKIVSPYNTF